MKAIVETHGWPEEGFVTTNQGRFAIFIEVQVWSDEAIAAYLPANNTP